MVEHFPLMVPGARAAAQAAEVCSPFDGSRVGTVECVDRGGVEQALATAHALFADRDRWLSPAQRIVILRQTAAIMQQRREELARGQVPRKRDRRRPDDASKDTPGVRLLRPAGRVEDRRGC